MGLHSARYDETTPAVESNTHGDGCIRPMYGYSYGGLSQWPPALHRPFIDSEKQTTPLDMWDRCVDSIVSTVSMQLGATCVDSA